MDTRITRITLQGFKSFNKKVSIPLFPGIVIICGPNGTGKSNLVDAICFVLGRTSAKSLRADRLHELIFFGYKDKKKPANYASVTLYLDNSKKVFPFEEKEISIQRKVNRKGICTYKVNGRTVTREKMLEVLSMARIYPEGHNIILQGDVTQVIEMNPIERREIIDEISGISEYNEKKRKAVKDLEAVDARLREAEIIVSERYEIFKKLEAERNAVIKYRKLQKELQILKASLAFRKVKDLNEELSKLAKNLEEKEEENRKVEREIEEIEKTIEEKNRRLREITDKLLEISKNVEAEKKISELRAELLIKKDRINSCRNEIERLTLHLNRLEKLRSKIEEVGEIPPSVKFILDLKLEGVHGILRDLIKIPEKYKTAIEVAAGNHLYDLVVKDDDVAKKCIEILKKEKIGRATFIPLNKIKPSVLKNSEILKKEGVINVASKLIEFDLAYAKAIEFIFGNTLVVENLDVATSIVSGIRIVTLDGDLIERSGLMVGGYLRRKEIPETKEIEECLEKRKELGEEISLLEKEVEEIERKLKEMPKPKVSEEIVELQKERIDIEKELEELRIRRKTDYERRIKLQEEINKLRLKRAKMEADLENAKLELNQYGSVEYLDEKAKVLEDNIQRVLKELESLGSINFKAEEEYEKFAKEFEGFKEKYEKILEEKKAVMNMIDKIEEKRREVFNNCLEKIRESFDEIFHEMTGGRANLELENPLDLDSGLIIEANPEGKNLLSIDAMSGGEKTLTALAFLFAIQKFRPAPFYVLDEIDAALDKENTKKVAEMIKKFSKDAQFIIITHNEQMIKYGDKVYGATMEEGETKILGIELPK